MVSEEYELPRWARPLRKDKLEQLYTCSSKGILDKELIDDVGFTLYARCLSILEVTDISVNGRIKCIKCENIVLKNQIKDNMLHCSKCNWKCPWDLYQKTYQRKGLFAFGMKEFINEFILKFEKEKSSSGKLILIDTLIHQFHWNAVGGKPSACNLLEGKMKTTMKFLDELTYGDNMPKEVYQIREEWKKKWTANPWSHGKGQ